MTILLRAKTVAAAHVGIASSFSNPVLSSVHFMYLLISSRGKVADAEEPEANPNFTPSFGRGESYWKLFIHTTGLDSGGNAVGPIVLDVVGSYETVNELIEGKLSTLCALIDWTQQGQFSPEEDNSAPLITDQFPARNQENVPITSPVVIRIRDPLAGRGIDVNTISLKIDGFSVSPKVYGNKFDYTLTFSPKPIINE